MENFTPVRNKYFLWNEVIVKGFKSGLTAEQIRNNLIDIFRKEVFDQMMDRMKVDDLGDAPQTPKNVRIVVNIETQAMNKWMSLMKECNKHLQTLNLMREEDLRKIFQGGEDEEDDEEAEDEDEEDGEYEIGEAEDGEADEEAVELPEQEDGQGNSRFMLRGADFDGFSDGPFEPKTPSWTP